MKKLRCFRCCRYVRRKGLKSGYTDVEHFPFIIFRLSFSMWFLRREFRVSRVTGNEMTNEIRKMANGKCSHRGNDSTPLVDRQRFRPALRFDLSLAQHDTRAAVSLKYVLQMSRRVPQVVENRLSLLRKTGTHRFPE